MYRNRIIPCLLLEDEGLVKTIQFHKPTYIGDPINAIRIYNEKEVDELIFLDIQASRLNREPNYEYLAKIADQCFMPLCYGGGINSIDQIHRVFSLGYEKVAINAGAYLNSDLIAQAAVRFGSQSIVAAMDIDFDKDGKRVVKILNGTRNTKENPIDYAIKLEQLGAGEILVNDISRDGKMCGYDLEMIRNISQQVHIPVVACGGASKLSDCADVIRVGASAAAAGSIFVYWGRLNGILINYPDESELKRVICN